MKNNKVAVIVSITSDIGTALAKRYARDGYAIVGTYRSKKQLNELKGISGLHIFPCDISDKKSIAGFIRNFKALGLKWDVFISCPCDVFPICAFFGCDFDEWNDSIHVNAIEQLRVLHELHPFRNKGTIADVVFFAGGGVNNAVLNFSAYTISKITLIKMCEFLDFENKDLNIFAVGPGWTKTKTHDLVLKKLDKADEKYVKTLERMESGKWTSMDDIYGCIRWLCKKGRVVAGGRNFSVMSDKWKGEESGKLEKELIGDPDMYKLRRHGNDWPSKK